MSVARVTELSASSEQGFADAIDQGIQRATSCPTWRSQLHRAEDQGCRVRRLHDSNDTLSSYFSSNHGPGLLGGVALEYA
jgi:dodecin